MKRHNFILFYLFLLSASAFGQTRTIWIKGQTTDSVSGATVNFATIEIRSARDSSLINGKLTDADATFSISLPTGSGYFLRISALGYQKKTYSEQQLLALGGSATDSLRADLGVIRLVPTGTQLKEVVISGQKNLIETVPGGFVYNTSKNTLAATSNLKDVLKQVPGVFLDKDGNLTLLGKGQTTVYINGKPTNLSGADLVNYLEHLNAADISRIVVNVNPTAKYDAAGTGGIIDIETKRNTNGGFNGDFSAGAGTHDKYNGNGDFNFNTEKTSSYLNLGYNHSNISLLNESTIANNYANDSVYHYHITSRSPNNPSSSFLLSTGSFISLDTTATLGFSFQYLKSKNSGSSNAVNDLSDRAAILQSSYTIDQAYRETSTKYVPDVNIRKLFHKKGEELVIDYNNFTFNKSRTDTSLDRYYDQNGNELFYKRLSQLQIAESKITVNSVKADFSDPFSHHISFQSGVKYTATNDHNNYVNQALDTVSRGYETIPAESYIFDYHEKIFASYVDFSGSLKGFMYKMGLRAENTNINFSSQSQANQQYQNNYLDWFPNLFFQQSLKNNQSISLSVSRRIDRPYYLNLNPFVNTADPNNLITGNPYLNPSIANSFVFTYSKVLGASASLISNFTYTRTSQPIGFILDRAQGATDSDPVNILKPENLNYSNYYGIFLILQNQLSKWMSLSTNLSVFWQNYNGFNVNLPAQNTTVSFFANIFSNITLGKGTYFQLFGTYISPQTSSQGRVNAYHTIDAGFQKTISSKLSLSASLSDIFNINKSSYTSNSKYITALITGHPESRVFRVTIKYNFGKNKPSKIKKYSPDANNRVQ